METMSLKEFRKKYNKIKTKTKNKFNAIRCEYNGINYDSTKEANYAKGLDLCMRSINGIKVKSWSRQIKFPIIVKGVAICKYYLDFKVEYEDGHVEYIDVKGYTKGTQYRLFKIKKKLVEAIYNINIKEV